MNTTSALVSAQWLKDNLATPDLTVVDGSWYLPYMERDALGQYISGHIPGAVYFDLDVISDHDTDLPHMLPTPQAFASAVGKLGIGDGQTIVVYDGTGMFSAARIWWMFKVMGAQRVMVLDGGLPAWIDAGGALEEGEPQTKERLFTPRYHASAVRDLAAMQRLLSEGRANEIFDARPQPRFSGEAPEPRAGIASGHIPGSKSLPFGNLLIDGKLKPVSKLAEQFKAAGLAPDGPVTVTCGSGVTAAILLLALHEIGRADVRLYDGAWAEWAAQPDAPIGKGLG